MKLCCTCAYYIHHPMDTVAKCRLGQVSSISGETTLYCVNARNIGAECGPDGKLWKRSMRPYFWFLLYAAIVGALVWLWLSS